jgi:AraC-like DNA-binding protein
VLPDGCLDLIWDGGRLFVAGPDSTARRHLSAAGTSYAALRFAGGTGPQLLGIPALALTRAGLPVAAIAERIGISPRQLHRRCLPVFGYGPARLARITRLGAAITRMRAGAALAEVAAQCGYADQAHLCREVRALVGTTPTALR